MKVALVYDQRAKDICISVADYMTRAGNKKGLSEDIFPCFLSMCC